MMRKFSLIIFLLISGATIVRSQKADKQIDKPNIIFILTDDQRWDALAYAGNNIIETPEMDKLAKEGVYFGSAVVTTPICAASRASIFSGLQERSHRYTFETGPLKEAFYQNSYPAVLKSSGYYTGFFGKFGVGYQSLDPLFDVYEDYDRAGNYKDRRGYFYKTLNNDTVHLTRYTGQQALDFIDNLPSDKPFCLSLSFSAPHAHDGAPEQYFWQEETDALYRNEEMPPPLISEDAYFDALPKSVRDGFNRLRWTWRYDNPEKYQHSVKGYYRMIRGIDLEIAKIRKKLREKGLDKNTVIILMGDNGYFLGERQLAGKWLMYDNSIRVPLIIYDPRVQKHQDIEEMALNIDVPPTILGFAGVPVPESWQGKSLVPIVEGRQKTIGRDTVLIEHLWDFDRIPPSEGVRTAEWKYMRYVNDQSEEELYNLKEDPLEIKNLADEKHYALVLEALRKKCDELGKKYGDPFSGTPAGLTVDFIRQPKNTEVNDLSPDYAWEVPPAAVIQNAYQVLVSSNQELIADNIGDIWDSGRVPGNASINVTHGGKALKPNNTYFWKVRIWDVDNRLSDYSEVQVFRTGVPNGLVTTNNIFEVDTLSPKSFIKTSADSYVIDFGKAAFATLELNYNAPQTDTLVFHIGEQLENGSVNRDPDGNIKYQRVLMPVSPGTRTYQLQITADERNTKPQAIALPDSFPVLMPFRYCEIENAYGLITKNDIRQLAFHAYFEENQSSFDSPDTVLNQVWDLCKYTIKATSFAGIYVDGERERIPYEADAYLNQLSHYNTDREYAVTRRTIEYFMENPTWPTEWQLHVALMMYQDYMYTGNTELIEKYYDQVKFKTLEGLTGEDGLISTQSDKLTPEFMAELGFKDPDAKLRDIVDWPPAQKDTGWKLATEEGERDGFVFMPVNTVINALFYKNMEIMALFAEVIGRPDEALDFQLKALKVKKSVNEKLFNPNTGAYVDGEGTEHSSLHANMFALAFGLVPDENVATVVNFMKTRGMACSVYGAQYLMEALYAASASEYALELLTETHDRSWYNMIAVGSTMTMEAWDMKYKPNADWNHAWGAVPANIIPRGLWGIRPQTPGFGIVRIEPQLADLPASSITVPTIRGLIKADFVKISNRASQYTVELPGNMVGEFFFPKSTDAEVSVNGRKVIDQFGSIRLDPGINVIRLNINTF